MCSDISCGVTVGVGFDERVVVGCDDALLEHDVALLERHCHAHREACPEIYGAGTGSETDKGRDTDTERLQMAL